MTEHVRRWDGADAACDIVGADPGRTTVLLGIDRKPVGLRIMVVVTVAGIVDQQVRVFWERTAVFIQRRYDFVTIGVKQDVDRESVLVMQQLRHLIGIVDWGRKRGQVFVVLDSDDQRIVRTSLVFLRPPSEGW